MKPIYLSAVCAMIAGAVGCSGSVGGTPQGSDGTSSADRGSLVTGVNDAGPAADLEAGSGPDAGDDTTPFLGTWPGNFNTNVNCPTSLPTMSSGADMLVINAGPAAAGAGVISVLTEDGCVFDYTVDGSTATALPHQVCPASRGGSLTVGLAVISRTLTLSGGELNEIGSVNITKNGVPCSQTEQGTYTQ